MKQKLRSGTALFLVLSLLLLQTAWASNALGHNLHFGISPLSRGASLHWGYFWSDTYSDLRLEHYVSYEPNESVQPSVSYGDSILQRATLSTMARRLESQGKRVVGGTNGDFYVLSTGQPLGMVVTDGFLRSSSSYHYAVGFRADGTAFIGQPNLRITASLPGERLEVSGGVNKVRQIQNADGGGLLLLTDDFSSTTENIVPGVDVFLRPVLDEDDIGKILPAAENGTGQDIILSEKPKIGGRVPCVVDYVTEAAGSNPIPKGMLVLTMNGQDDPEILNKLRALQPGDEVNLDITSPDPRWAEATEALGAMYLLLHNGQISTGLNAERTARTAIGIKPDGTVLFYTLDGKQPGWSVGATCTQIAMRLAELGCTEAIGLDGGGSTTIGVTYPEQNAMEVINSPADGAERANSNAIFLTTEMTPTGEAGTLSLEPQNIMVFPGTEIHYSASVLDTAYYPMGDASDVTYSVSGAGTISEDGVFFSGTSAGFSTITGTMGDLTGSTLVTVIDSPDTLQISNEATGAPIHNLSLEPGEQISLSAASLWHGFTLYTQDTDYFWECDIGTIDPDGTFTAVDSGSGTLQVTAGGKTVSIPINVAGHISPLEDMETENPAFASTDTASVSWETDQNHVRMGKQSLRVYYQVDESNTAQFVADLPVPVSERYLSMWVMGDGSGNLLTANVTDDADMNASVYLCNLDFTGWRHILTELPEGASRMTDIQIQATTGLPRGTIWLDQFITANDHLEDLTPPSVYLKIKGNQLTASISDNIDQSFPASAIHLFCDGFRIDFTWDVSTDTLHAVLPDAQARHRITVTATDISGNLARASKDYGTGATLIFADLEDHWASSYADYLYQESIVLGVSTGEERIFQPESEITRAEFFTMVARWLHCDLSPKGDTAFSFVDQDTIPDWAVPAVHALLDAGLIEENPSLFLRPNVPITRAEAVTILGHTQERGFPETDLNLFSDGWTTPDWAVLSFRSLIGQGVIDGFSDGSLRPEATLTRAQVAKILTVLR